MLKEKKLHIHLKNIDLPRKQKNKKNHNKFVILEKQVLLGNFFKLRLTVVFIADTNIYDTDNEYGYSCIYKTQSSQAQWSK